MSRFFKFLIMVAAIANILLLFVFDGQIPSNIPIPFITKPAESEEVVAEEPAVEETVLPEETEEVTEPEAEEEEEVLPEQVAAEEEIQEVTAEEETQEEALPECRIISPDGSNIRSGPSLDNEVIASYPYDTVLVLTGEFENGWYSILAEDGTEGYIFETQIELPEGYITEEMIY